MTIFKLYAVNDADNFSNKSISNIIQDKNFGSNEFPYYKAYLEPIGLEFEYNHVVNQFVYLDDHKEHLKELESRLSKLDQFSKFDKGNEVGAKKLKDYIDEIYSENNTTIDAFTYQCASLV